MSHKPKNKIVSALETWFLKNLGLIFRILPHRLALKHGANLALFFHDTVGIRKKHAIKELLTCFPEKDEKWARQQTRGVYRHFGKMMAEMYRIPHFIRWGFGGSTVLDEDSEKIMRECVERGKGTFIVSGHMGNWETAGALACYMGFPIDFLVGRQSNSGVEELLDVYRRMSGIEIIKAVDAGKGILRSLRKNRMVAVMIDQDARKHGVFVPFFNRLSSTPRGVARFAVKMKPSLVFMHTYRRPDDKIAVKILPVEFEYSGDNEKDIYDLTAKMTAMLEGFIRENPDQWLWLHRRWKTAPPEENSTVYKKA